VYSDAPTQQSQPAKKTSSAKRKHLASQQAFSKEDTHNNIKTSSR